MTAKCKNCGHNKKDHFIAGCIEINEITGEECDCKKFQPEDAPKVYIERAAKLDREGIRAVCGTEKEYSGYVKKQKKGCGKVHDCGTYYRGNIWLCQSCSNQSPEIPVREKGRSSVKAITLQDKSPQEKISSRNSPRFTLHPEGTFNLSDKIYSHGFPSCNMRSKDVKEFIRLLKENMKSVKIEGFAKGFVDYHIDKLAGSKLLKGEELT